VESVQHWLSALPPGLIYALVAIVVGTESLGVPLPGETALVAAALLATSGITNVWWVAIAASLGAIVGDSIGYAIGRRGGRSLLEWLGRRFPNHLGPPHLAKAEQIFQRRGAWAIFFGRFIALLRIFAGPLAGALRVRYSTFLLANASGGILWASGTAFAVYAAGKAADRWLKNFSWIALAVAIVAGIVTTLILRHRAKRSFGAQHDEDDQDTEPSLTG
jgi:membrane protein DedA with SNARE-associated domain